MSRTSLVCFAVPQEVRPFLTHSSIASSTDVLVTGMGARRAERRFQEALHGATPSIVFTCGFAGALIPSLRVADLVFDAQRTDAAMARALIALGCQPARFYCASRVAVSAAEKRLLRAQSGADVVEMESGVIQRICSERGISCVTLRAVSDTSDEDLPLDFNQLTSADEQLSPWRLALAILKAPQKIPALMKLGANSKRAGEALARVLVQVV